MTPLDSDLFGDVNPIYAEAAGHRRPPRIQLTNRRILAALAGILTPLILVVSGVLTARQ